MQNAQNESFDRLRDLLAPKGKDRKTVYSILRHVSKSGMMRRISFIVIDEEGQPRNLDWLIKQVTGYNSAARGEGLVVRGCGMDMGFHVVYGLGSKLWPEGTAEPHGTRNGEPDSAGGYAIKQAWL